MMIKLRPNTRLLFWDEEMEKLWKPRISKISAAYNKVEFETFLRDMRKIYIYHAKSESYRDSYDLMNQYDLVFIPTNESGVYTGFAHGHLKRQPGKPYMVYGAMIKHRNRKLAKEFQIANDSGDHITQGRMLSYPRCDTNFFMDVWNKVSVDPIYEIAVNTEGSVVTGNTVETQVHPYCNQMLRYVGIRITPHLPCSDLCEETIKLGKKWYSIMKKIDKEAAEWAYELLSMPLVWDCLKGVAIIDTDLFRLVTNSDGTPEKKIVKSTGYQ